MIVWGAVACSVQAMAFWHRHFSDYEHEHEQE
jgi:hypothetical protein